MSKHDKLYKLTPEGYQQLLEAQGGVCAICKKPPLPGKKLAVDHDHATGKIRGLLCILCNSTLGYFQDNPETVRAALSYLLRNETKRSWDHYFMDIADVAAFRSKDLSNQVGAVLVRDRQILSSGYNGFPAGVNDALPERMVRPTKYIWTVHAEINAIMQAGKHGIRVEGASLYVSPLSPCVNCAKAIIQSGVVEVICRNPGAKGQADQKDSAEELLQAAKVILRKPE